MKPGFGGKKMLNRTFISKNEKTAPGFKVSKDRVTLLLCSNASGDYMAKPMLIYRSLNPRALKGINKNALPVYWKANSKAWVTADLFRNWFLNCFVPEVESYLKRNNLNFKALLLVDNAPGHPQDLCHPNVQIVFLPPNTTSLLQPLDQGIIYTFKTYYIRRSLQWILDVTDSKSIDVKLAWKQFSIKDCIDIISLSLKELKITTLNRCWKKIWPAAVVLGSAHESGEKEIGAILECARLVGGEGFVDMAIEDIQDLLVEQEIGEADLVEMASEPQINEIDSSSDEYNEVNILTLKKLQEGLDLAKKLELLFLDADPCAERSRKFKRELQNCLSPYQEIYNNLERTRKQGKITDFFKVSTGEKNSNVSSEGTDDSIRLKKHSHLMELSSDNEKQ